MGYIKRQGFKKSIVSYTGVLIGGLSVIFIYSDNKEIYGLAQFLLSSAMLLSPLILLGASNVSIRFFPTFENRQNGHNGLLSLSLLQLFLGALLTSLFYVLFKPIFRDGILKISEDPLFIRFAEWVLPLAILYSLANLLQSYTTNFKRIVVPGIINNLFSKISLATLVFLHTLNILSDVQFVFGILCMYCMIILMMFGYLGILSELRLTSFRTTLKPKLLKEIVVYSSFGLLGAVGSHLTLRLDSIMIGNMEGMTSNGAYNMLVFFINTLEIPSYALYAILGPVIAKAMKNNSLTLISDYYQRSSLVLFISGILLLGNLVLNIEDFVLLLPDSHEFESVLPIIILLGCARLINLVTSINTYIILYSQKFRYNLLFVLSLGLLNVFFNYKLIGSYGVVGAAMATFLSLSCYNLIKYLFIWKVFGMQPLTRSTFWALIVGGVVFLFVFFLPMDFKSPILLISLRVCLFSAIYILVILYFKLSKDVNQITLNSLNKVKKFLKN